ncbi:hypothetical protein BGZ65_011423, partial [Modicella reniformis]
MVVHSSLPSSPSTVSLAGSLVDVRQLDSGVDLQESPRPVNRRSNRDFRIIPPDEMEIMNEASLQDSIIRHSQTPPPRRSLLQQQQQQQQQQLEQQTLVSTVNAAQEQGPMRFDKSPILELHEDEEDSYFGDILDKYCNSEDETTVITTITTTTTTPTSPFRAPPAAAAVPAGSKVLQQTAAAQPPTPSSSSRFSNQQHHTTAPPTPPPRRGSGTSTTAAATAAAAVLRNHSSSPLPEAPARNSRQDNSQEQ